MVGAAEERPISNRRKGKGKHCRFAKEDEIDRKTQRGHSGLDSARRYASSVPSGAAVLVPEKTGSLCFLKKYYH